MNHETHEKKQNHEGARKNLRTTNGREGARIIFSKPRNTRNTRKKQNHEGARKNLRTTNGHEWARIKFSKPRSTRNRRRCGARTTNGHEGARIKISKPRNTRKTRKQEAAWGQNHGRASSRGTGSLFPDKVGLRQFVCIRSLSPLPRGRSVPGSFARIVSAWRA